MNLSQLEVLVAIVDTGILTEAAAVLAWGWQSSKKGGGYARWYDLREK